MLLVSKCFSKGLSPNETTLIMPCSLRFRIEILQSQRFPSYTEVGGVHTGFSKRRQHGAWTFLSFAVRSSTECNRLDLGLLG